MTHFNSHVTTIMMYRFLLFFIFLFWKSSANAKEAFSNVRRKVDSVLQRKLSFFSAKTQNFSSFVKVARVTDACRVIVFFQSKYLSGYCE